MSYAFLFPGQGSQQVGMAQALVAQSRAAAAVFEEADDVLGFRLSRLCFEGPEQELMLTANAQPAIVATSIAALRALQDVVDLQPSVALGHSLGEFSALVSVGALRLADALRVVRLRGEAMQEAVPAGVGGMAAIMGLTVEQVDELCRAAIQGTEVLAPANENGGGQVVIAGHVAPLQRALELAKERGGKAIPLKVSAPFHCALMAPAAERLAAALETVAFGSMSAPVIANVDAEPNGDPGRIRDLLVRQVTHRVRWEASVHRVAAQGIAAALEIGHGKVLAGLIRRIAPALKVTPVGSPGDIDVLKEGSHGVR